MSGTLYVIGTPIGNLKDISPRVLEAIAACECIYAEDTRVSIKLLNHLDVKKKLLSYHKHNEREKLEEIGTHLREGKTIGLVSDAGMPVISDPGHEMIQLAATLNAKIVPIAGPTAFVLALVASGLPADRFVFEGFLPDKQNDLIKALEGLKDEVRTIILYVSPHKIARTLKEMLPLFGNRRACLARDITKYFEEFRRMDLKSLLQCPDIDQLRGELVLVIHGREPESSQVSDGVIAADWWEHKDDRDLVVSYVRLLVDRGEKLMRAAKMAADKFGIEKDRVYRSASDDMSRAYKERSGD